MSSDKSEDVNKNEADDKCLNEISQLSRYKRMIYVILIMVLVVLFVTVGLRWISGNLTRPVPVEEVAESLEQRTGNPFKLFLLLVDRAGRQSYPHHPFMTDRPFLLILLASEGEVQLTLPPWVTNRQQ